MKQQTRLWIFFVTMALMALASCSILPEEDQKAWSAVKALYELKKEHDNKIDEKSYKAAGEIAIKANTIAQSAFGEKHMAATIWINHRANALLWDGRLEESLLLKEQVAGHLKENGNDVTREYATMQNDIAEINFKLGREREGREASKNRLSVLDKLLQDNDPILIEAHNNYGIALLETGDHYAALSQLLKAVERAAEVHDRNSPVMATMLSNVAVAYAHLEQYSKAKHYYTSALRIYENNNNEARLFDALHDLGRLAVGLGDYEAGLAQLQRAMGLAIKNGEINISTYKAYVALGSIYYRKGEYEESERYLNSAINMARDIATASQADMSSPLTILAGLKLETGDYIAALDFGRRARELASATYGVNNIKTMLATNNVAVIYTSIGQHNEAIKLLSDLHEQAARMGGVENYLVALMHNNIGQSFSEIGQHDKAVSSLHNALSAFEMLLGQKHPEYARTLDNLGRVYSAIGRIEEGRSYSRRAREVYSQTFGRDHIGHIYSTANIGNSYLKEGRCDDAVEYFTEALQDAQLLSGNGKSRIEAILFGNIAECAIRNEELDFAIAMLKASVNIHQAFRGDFFGKEAEAFSAYTKSHEIYYTKLADLLIQSGRYAEAESVLGLLKNYELSQFVSRSNSYDILNKGAPSNEAENYWLGKYRSKAIALTTLAELREAILVGAHLSQRQEQAYKLHDINEKLLTEKASFERLIIEMRAAFKIKKGVAAAGPEQASSLQMALKLIDKDTVLVNYYILEDKLGILMTTPTTHVIRYSSVPLKELNRKIFSYGQLLRVPSSSHLVAAQDLYNILVKPIEADLVQAGAKTVMLSLDGNLRHLPFASLHDGKRYLVERWNLPMYTSVTKDRLLDDMQPNWRVAGLGVTRQWGDLAPLPGVRAELTGIIKNGEEGILPGEMYLDEAFTSDRLRTAGGSKTPVVHISSHFQFSPGTEANSYLLLGDGKRLTLGDLRTQNYRFDGVDLLTLSACETAQGGGHDTRGREIEGFGVIAQKQGAKSVLATLWKIEDQSTAGFMADMYRQRQVLGLNKAAALRQAQINMMKNPKHAHPYYWAPFILMGNWR